MTALGGVLVALGIADANEASTLQSGVDAAFASVMSLIGISAIIAGNVWSWVSPAKKIGEGD